MAPKLSGFEPAGLSHVGSYAGEIPQSATKAKNDKRIESRIGVGMGRFTPGTNQQGNQKLYRDSEHVRKLVVDTLNTSCEALSSLFDNNYLRCDLMKLFFVTFCCITCFWTIKKQWVDSLKVI